MSDTSTSRNTLIICDLLAHISAARKPCAVEAYQEITPLKFSSSPVIPDFWLFRKHPINAKTRMNEGHG
jgi:hypothetical protein